MKIEYRAQVVGAGAYTVLADESVSTLAAAISGFHPHVSKSPMQSPAYGGAVPITEDMGNARWGLEFTVARVHASADAALLFILNELLKFPGNVDLKITVGAQVNYLANTSLLSLDPEPASDQSSTIRYAFTGGRLRFNFMDPKTGLAYRSTLVLTPNNQERPIWVENAKTRRISGPLEQSDDDLEDFPEIALSTP